MAFQDFHTYGPTLNFVAFIVLHTDIRKKVSHLYTTQKFTFLHLRPKRTQVTTNIFKEMF